MQAYETEESHPNPNPNPHPNPHQAYETEESGGGWLPVLRDVTDPEAGGYDDPVSVPTVPPSAPAAGKRTPQLNPPSPPEASAATEVVAAAAAAAATEVVAAAAAAPATDAGVAAEAAAAAAAAAAASGGAAVDSTGGRVWTPRGSTWTAPTRRRIDVKLSRRDDGSRARSMRDIDGWIDR